MKIKTLYFVRILSISFLFLCSSSIPIPAFSESIRNQYRKLNSCNLSNANYKGDPYNGYQDWWHTPYFCVFSDGSIWRFTNDINKSYDINKIGDTKKEGNLNTVKITSPQWVPLLNYMTDGGRSEFALEGNYLVRYGCEGYTGCSSAPVRHVLGKKRN